MKKSDTTVYKVNKDVNDNPLETVQFEPAYGGDDYTLTDNPCYVTEDLKMSRDPHCVSEDRVTLQKQNYSSLDLKSVQTSAYVPLVSNRNSSPAISKYRDNINEYYIYEFPEKVVPRKKSSTQQTHESTNWNVNSQQHGEGDQSSVDKKSSNKIPSTSGPGEEVGKETTAPQKSQVFASDVTMPTKKENVKKENISDAHHVMLPEKHEQREKVPPPTKPRPNTSKKQSTLSPTQESATPGVKGVGKETTAPRKSQVFVSDVTMPTKKENISDTHHVMLPEKHEQREKVPPPTKPRPNTSKKQSTLSPTQESATPGVKGVGKETTAPRKSQVFASDVTMPTKKENISDTHHVMLPEKHEQREKVPPPTKPRPNTSKKQSTLSPTQESATPGVKGVGKETTAPRKSQVFVSDVTMPTKKENISDTHHVMLPEKHEQREKVPPPTKPRPNTSKKQSTLSPTQESATPGVKGVGKETTAPRKSQVFVSDVTMPTKKENISDTHHVMLPEKHEQREKVPPPTKPRPNTSKKQSTLSPTQESATPGVKGVGKETTAPRKSQVFVSDVTIPTKKENISDVHHVMLPEKHEQREKVPPPTKPRPNTNKKQSTLPPTQESSTPKPQAHPQQPNPVMTGSPLDATSIPPKTKKRSFLAKKAFPVDTEQPPRGPNVTELRKIIEKVFS